MGNAVTGATGDRAARTSYIVHVYRRSDQPGHEVAGLIEPVEGGKPSPFAGRDELWAVLASEASATNAARSRRRPAKPNP
ncbi:MAG: hypothetical protein K2Y35_18475 [Burkholderiales bacterium]|nr:hypothetical protein [Burkholderiales bacterium]